MYLTDKNKYQLLFEISQKVRDTLDLDEIMEHLLDTVKTVVDYDAAGIFVLNQDLVHGRHEQPEGMIAGVARRGFDSKPAEEDAMLTSGKGIIGHVIFSGASLVVPDVCLDARYIEGRSFTRSEIAVPIMRNERAIGALNLESDQLSAYDDSDLEVLQFFADAAAISIEKAMLHRQLLEKNVVDRQLELARELQSRLFPDETLKMSGYDIAGICLPAEEIGGDFYDFIQLPKGGMGIVVADISGHGIPAALVMSAFRGLLRINACGRLGPANIARTINRQLPEFTGDGHFITAIYGVMDPPSGEFTYTSCGHQPPLLIRPDGSVASLKPHGPALGVLSDASYPTSRLLLSHGDILLLYTDGVLDINDQAGEEFGVERLVAAIYESRDLTAAEMINMVIRKTRAFSNALSYRDDFTLVTIKRI